MKGPIRMMFFNIILLLITIGNSFEIEQELESSKLEGDKKLTNNRDSKLFWPFFNLIILEEPCKSQVSSTANGTCVTSKTCTARAGTASGTCANGLAVCCISQKTCGTSSSQNLTHFVSPSYTSGDSTIGSCTFELNYPSNVCQVRLDFIDFSLAQPESEDGLCTVDSFTVTGGATSTVPTICGENTGQHMYVDVNSASPPLRMMVLRSSGNTGLLTRWNIKVTQIPCGASYAAQPNCLQYFTDAVGSVTSFNYVGQSDGQKPAVDNQEQLSNQNYAICVRPNSDFCSITWSRNANLGNYGFSITNIASSLLPNVAGNVNAGNFDNDCTTDYVIIPGSTYNDGTDDVTGDRFCGLGFPTAVTTTTKPFNILVVFDANEDLPDASNQGFSLNWIANIC